MFFKLKDVNLFYVAMVFCVLFTPLIKAVALEKEVKPSVGITADSYEHDDSFATARVITSGQAQERSIDSASDIDYVKFTLTEESCVSIETSGMEGDTVLTLYDSTQSQIAYDDDGGEGGFSRIEVNDLPAGIYYVMVNEYSGNDIISSYKLSFEVNRGIVGDGSELNPYQISTADQLEFISQRSAFWGESFVLVSDIDMRGRSITPIGNDSNRFSGVFDGGEFFISNLNIEALGYDHIGFFGYTESAVINNLGLVDVYVTGRAFVGTLVGRSLLTEINNSFATGSVVGRDHVGGLVGRNGFSSPISNCNSSVYVYSSSSYAGGLVGFNQSSNIKNCYAVGKVDCNSTYSGSLAGGSDTQSKFINCYWDVDTTGMVSSPVVDPAHGLSSSEFMQKDFSVLWSFGSNYANPWIDNGVNYYPTLYWQPPIRINFLDTVVASEYEAGEGTEENPYQIKNLSQLRRLSETSTDWDKHFVLTSDIDASPTHCWNATNHDNSSLTPDKGTGFSPIGKYDPEFTGSFDGCGYTIDNIFIDRDGNRTGFFGNVNGATISNVNITNSIVISGNQYAGILIGYSEDSKVYNCHVKGVVRTDSIEVGGFVGVAYESSLANCSFEGSVTGGTYSDRIGGFVGRADHSTIVNCYINSITTGDDNVGGIIGGNIYSSDILNCYAMGEVYGDDNVGGIVGSGKAIIDQCYSIASVNGSSDTGALVGSAGTSLTVTNCYWDRDTSGCISSAGSDDSFGLSSEKFITKDFSLVWEFGEDDSCPWCYFETESYPILYWQNVVLELGHIGELMAHQSKELNFFAEVTRNYQILSFSLTGNVPYGATIDSDSGEFSWTPTAGQGGKAYVFTIQATAGTDVYSETITITVNRPPIAYVPEVVTVDELELLTFTVLSSDPDGDEVKYGLVGDVPTGALVDSETGVFSWIPVADQGGEYELQIQVSDGFLTDIKIVNIIVNSSKFANGAGTALNPFQVSTAEELAVIGTGPNFWDKHYFLTDNIDMKGILVAPIGNLDTKFTGSFTSKGFVISNLNIETEERYAGLFGYIESAVVSNIGLENVAVRGGSYTGALVGYSDSSTVSGCYTAGTVETYANYIGGLVGYADNTVISNCYSRVDVKGSIFIGGLIGYCVDSEITSCYSTGNAGGDPSYCGGLAGRVYTSSVSNSYWDKEKSVLPHSYDISSVFGLTSEEFVGKDFSSIWGFGSDDDNPWVDAGVDDYPSLYWQYKLGQFSFVNVNEHDTLRFKISHSLSLSDDLTFGLIGDNIPFGASIDSETGVFSWAPTSHECGIYYTFTIRVTDGLNVDSGEITVNANVIPVIGEIENLIVDKGVEVKFTVNVVDRDSDNLMFSLSKPLPFGATINPISGEFEWITRKDHGGVNVITINVTDGYSMVSKSVNINVNDFIFAGGDGTAGNPFQIATSEQLVALSSNGSGYWDNHFVLLNDIDMTGQYMKPIGSRFHEFCGSFNGNGFTINNLVINRPTESYVGLFGHTYRAEISNLGMENVDITGKSSVGGIVGRNYTYSTVRNCYVSGVVNVYGFYGGGVVGDNTEFCLVENCYSTAAITALKDGYQTGAYIGGIVGSNWSSIVKNCYASGRLYKEANLTVYAGAVVAQNRTHISEEWLESKVENCYWDKEATGLDSSDGSEVSCGLTSAEFTAKEFSSVWSFGADDENPWVDAGEDSYPELYWQRMIQTKTESNVDFYSSNLTGWVNTEVSYSESGFEISKDSSFGYVTRYSVASYYSGDLVCKVNDLNLNTTYFYRAYMIRNGYRYYGDIRQFTTLNVNWSELCSDSEVARNDLYIELIELGVDLEFIDLGYMAEYQKRIIQNVDRITGTKSLEDIISSVNHDLDVFFYEMNYGWNLVHVPVINPVNRYDCFDHLSGPSWSWNAEVAVYEVTNSFVNGAGCWLFWNAEADIASFAGTFAQPTRELTDLHVGWNLIGIVEGDALPVDRVVGIWEWDGTISQYVVVEQGDVESNKGYWIFCDR